MTQGTLRDFGVDVEETDEEPQTISRYRLALKEAPEGAEPLDELSCPWCLGSKDDFVVRTDEDSVGEVPGGRIVSCGHCNAVIPVSADWYLNGEKICLQT